MNRKVHVRIWRQAGEGDFPRLASSLQEVFSPDATRTRYQYDNLGNLVRVTRAFGVSTDERVVDYAYDGLNRLRRERQYPDTTWPADPNGSTGWPMLVAEHTYDGNGNRVALKQPRDNPLLGEQTTFVYDALDRLITIDYSDPNTADARYEYDAHGNRTLMVDGTGTTTYAYDELDRVLSVTSPWPTPGAGTVSYRYDEDGNRVKVVYPPNSPGGTDLNYAFDKAGRLEAVHRHPYPDVGYTYFPDGKLRQATNLWRGSTQYSYDNLGRLTEVWNQLGLNTISRHTYTLDSVGNRTRMDEVLPQLGPPGFTAEVPPSDAFMASRPELLQAAALQVGPLGQLASTPTVTPTATVGPLSSSTATGTPVATATPSATPTPAVVALTSTATTMPAAVATPTATATATPTPTPGRTLTPTASATASASPSPSSTATPGPSPSATRSATGTATPTVTAVATAAASLTATATRPVPTSTPTLRPAELPLHDQTQDPRQTHRYRAEAGSYTLELFEKASGAANVRLAHLGSDTLLGFELPGPTSGQTAVGAAASAQVGVTTVHWTSYADRLKEELVLASRPASDQVVFTLQQRGLRFEPDGQGGYLARDALGLVIFHLLAPTAQDAVGQAGAANLTVQGSTAVLRLDPVFLATAVYPVTVDPTVIYTDTAPYGTGFNNSPRLLQDSYGKLLLLTVSRKTGSYRLAASYSNDGGQTWTHLDDVTQPATSIVGGATWVLATDQSTLHAAYQTSSGLTYQRYTIGRGTDNNVTGITAGLAVVLDSTAPGSPRPSIVLDKHGWPAVAWMHRDAERWEMRFLRAMADPTVRTNWVNAQGSSTSPDVLGTVLVGNLLGTASLARMPTEAGPNGDALYQFWVESSSNRLYWSKATVQGSNYAAWSAPVDQGAAYAGPQTLATASDATNRAIVVAHYGSDQSNRLSRIPGEQDTAWETLVGPPTPLLGWGMSVGVDRGDLYVFYWDASYRVVYRRYLQGRGWDASDTWVDSTTSNIYPTARQELSDGQVDVAWTRINPQAVREVVHDRRAVSRPFIRNVSASPSPFTPLAGQSATIRYSLADDGAAPLAVTVRVYDGGGGLVRTLLDGSLAPGAQSSVDWDGKSNGGTIQLPGTYTVKINAIDGEGLAAPEQTTTVAITRQATTIYRYDDLYRLIRVEAPAGMTEYTYDRVGNRLTRAGYDHRYSIYPYDRADRLQGQGGSVTYETDENGNLWRRANGSFAYDQANRMEWFFPPCCSNTATYTYDGDGLLVRRRLGQIGALTTNYLYDVNRPLPVLLDDTNRKYVWGLGPAYAVNRDAWIDVFYTDGLGSVRAIVDPSTDEVYQTYLPDEFGNSIITQGARGQLLQFAGAQFDGERRWDDGQSGLYYLRTRMYDPSLGRFLQRDPFPGFTSNPSSLNGYTYVENNPVNDTDPSGLHPLLLACGGGALFSMAVDAGATLLAGNKVTGSQLLKSGIAGCAGAALGPIGGAVLRGGSRLILQRVTTSVNAELAGNPALAQTVLRQREYAAGQVGGKLGLAYMQYGNAMERLVRDRVRDSQVLKRIFTYVGGPSQPDFVGSGLLRWIRYDITTPGEVADHYRRWYGPGLQIVTYNRPTSFVGFP